MSITNPLAFTLGSSVWDAGMNSPTLPPTPATTATPGTAYLVTNAGDTSLSGISNWNLGDIVFVLNNEWQKITGQNLSAASYISVTPNNLPSDFTAFYIDVVVGETNTPYSSTQTFSGFHAGTTRYNLRPYGESQEIAGGNFAVTDHTGRASSLAGTAVSAEFDLVASGPDDFGVRVGLDLVSFEQQPSPDGQTSMSVALRARPGAGNASFQAAGPGLGAVALVNGLTPTTPTTVGLIKVTNIGSGCNAPPVVTMSGGGGHGAKAIAAVDPGTLGVSQITVTDGGSGYT